MEATQFNSLGDNDHKQKITKSEASIWGKSLKDDGILIGCEDHSGKVTTPIWKQYDERFTRYFQTYE